MLCVDVHRGVSSVETSSAESDDNLISACGEMYVQPVDYRATLVRTMGSSLHVGSETLTASFDPVPPPSFYRDGSHLKGCTVQVQILDDDQVPGNHVVKQSLQNCDAYIPQQKVG